METLLTPRLILKCLSEDDVPSIQNNFSRFELVRYLNSSIPWPYPENGALKYFQELKPDLGKKRWVWSISLKEKPHELIGVIELCSQKEKGADNRGFWLSESHWGKGLMTEASEVVTDYWFFFLGFQEMILSNALSNEASRRLKLKVGATRLGVQKGDFIDKTVEKKEVWLLTKDQWKSYKSQKC